MKRKKKIVFSLNKSLYPLDIIYGACFSFLDRCYIYLDYDKDRRIKIQLTTMDEKTDGEKIAGEFKNELIMQGLRKKIAMRNKKIRELIIEKALFGTAFREEKMIEEEELDYIKDPLGIAIPWEEKYGKKEKKD